MDNSTETSPPIHTQESVEASIVHIAPPHVQMHLEEILLDPKSCMSFGQFLKRVQEDNIHLLACWIEIQTYKKLWAMIRDSVPDELARKIRRKAREVFEKYLSKPNETSSILPRITASSAEFGIDPSSFSDTSDLERRVMDPTIGLFDDAHDVVFHILARESYPEFIESIEYKKYRGDYVPEYHEDELFYESDSGSSTSTSPSQQRKFSMGKRAYGTMKRYERGNNRLTQFGLTKEKANLTKILERHLTDWVAGNDWICYVHIVAELEVWKLIRFDNNTTVQQALQKITKVLNQTVDSDSNWEDYVLGATKDGQLVTFTPLDKPLKSFFPDNTTQYTFDFRNKNVRRFTVISSSRLLDSAVSPATTAASQKVATVEPLEKIVTELKIMMSSAPKAKEKLDEALNSIKHERKLLEASVVEVLRLIEENDNLRTQHEIIMEEMKKMKVRLQQMEIENADLKKRKKALEEENEVLTYCLDQRKPGPPPGVTKPAAPPKPKPASARGTPPPLPPTAPPTRSMSFTRLQATPTPSPPSYPPPPTSFSIDASPDSSIYEPVPSDLQNAVRNSDLEDFLAQAAAMKAPPIPTTAKPTSRVLSRHNSRASPEGTSLLSEVMGESAKQVYVPAQARKITLTSDTPPQTPVDIDGGQDAKKRATRQKSQQEEFLEAIKTGEDVEDYISKGVNINERDENGFTPLHWAAQTGNMDALIKLLSTPNIDLNCTDRIGWTPLHYACHAGHMDVIRLLMQQRGIDDKKRTNAKKKPKDVAKSKEIVQILNESKAKLKKDLQFAKEMEKAEIKKQPKNRIELKRVQSFRTMQRKLSRSTDSLLHLVKAACYKTGFMQFYSNGRWKERWLSLSKECLLVEYPESKHNIKRMNSSEFLPAMDQSSETLPEFTSINVKGEMKSVRAVTDTMIFIADIREITYKELEPDFFTNIFPNNEGHIFAIILTDSRVCYLRATNKMEMVLWMLAVDGMKCQQGATAMTNIAKNSLLGYIFKEEKFKGGEITSLDGEKWTYTPDNVLKCVSLEQDYPYPDQLSEWIWNGKNLVPKGAPAASMGIGVWNGVTLEWLNTAEKNAKVAYAYAWNDAEKEFLPPSIQSLSRGDEFIVWQMNLHSLSGKVEAQHRQSLVYQQGTSPRNEYQMEGSIPFPVVTFLPMMKNARRLFVKYEKLEKLLLECDADFWITMFETINLQKADQLAQSLINIYEKNGKTLDMIKAFIVREVNSGEDFGTLFRSNSMASKLMKFYCKLVGQNYLQSIFVPLFRKLQGQSFEIDPLKMGPNDDKLHNFTNLRNAIEDFFTTIIGSMDRCPPQIWRMCHDLAEAVKHRFPGKYVIAVGGFIFLRFFCPAILLPTASGIMEEVPSESVKRGLVLMTKVLQNLSNDILFKEGEEYMMPLNEWLTKKLPLVREYLEKLSRPPPTTAIRKMKISRESELSSFGLIHTFLEETIDVLETCLPGQTELVNSFRTLLKTKPFPPFIHQTQVVGKSTAVNPPLRRIESMRKPAPPSQEAFKEKLSRLKSDLAKQMISDILKELEEEKKLIHLVEILIIRESVDKFIISILESSASGKADWIKRMNAFLQESINNDYSISSAIAGPAKFEPFHEDTIAEQLPKLSKEKQLKLANLFLQEFQQAGILSKLLEGTLFKHESLHSSMFAFLLHLAAINDDLIRGMYKIYNHLIRVEENMKSDSKPLLLSTLEELNEKIVSAHQLQLEAESNSNKDEASHYSREIDGLEQEILLLKNAFPKARNYALESPIVRNRSDTLMDSQSELEQP